jgi:hypothetical protein
MEAGDLFEGEALAKAAPPVAQPPPTPVPETRPLDEPAETRIVRPAEPQPAVPAPGILPTPQPAPPAQPPGLDVSVAEPAGPTETGTPFYKTWWFWTGVGAAVVAGTVVAIVAASSGKQGNTAATALGTQAVFQ